MPGWFQAKLADTDQGLVEKHPGITALQKLSFILWFVCYDFYFLNASPSFVNNSCSFGIVLFPMPWSRSISASEYFESCCSVSIPLFSKARLAGAASWDRKPSFGLRIFSHTGQLGQSLLFKYECPFLQILIVFLSVSMLIFSLLKAYRMTRISKVLRLAQCRVQKPGCRLLYVGTARPQNAVSSTFRPLSGRMQRRMFNSSHCPTVCQSAFGNWFSCFSCWIQVLYLSRRDDISYVFLYGDVKIFLPTNYRSEISFNISNALGYVFWK